MREIKLVQENDPQILILKEKHGNAYYIVNSEKELHDICVDVLKDRLGRGLYDVWQDEEDIGMGFNSIEEIEKIPDGKIKQVAKSLWDSHMRVLKEQNDLRSFNERVKKAINYEFNPKEHIYVRNQAYYCLTEREMYEYEKMSLELPTNVRRKYLKSKQ